jgi:signal transduction histidine kinase
MVVSTLRIPKPPADIIEKYEEAKKAFTTALFARGLATSTLAEGIAPPTYREVVDDVLANRHQYSNDQGNISMAKIAMAYNFGDKKTRSLKSMLESTGESVDK